MINHLTDKYKIAVLIPVYNCQDSLISTLNSFDKSFPVYVLIIDDGSQVPININKDNFYPHTIEIYSKKFNSGIEESLRLGVEIIDNYGFEFFARIDAGDICKNNRFKLQYEFIKNDINLSWIGGSADIVDYVRREKFYTLISIRFFSIEIFNYVYPLLIN